MDIRGVGYYFILVSATLLGVLPCSGQFLEFGLGSGIITYNGDLNTSFNFSSPSPGGSFICRFNLNNTISTRVGIMVGQISGSDTQAEDILSSTRGERFNTQLGEVSGCVEYYFIDYQTQYDQLKMSPYLFVGAGLFTYATSGKNASSVFEPSIPFGIGLRKLIGRNHATAMGIEFGMRKTFTDNIDNISGGDPNIKNFMYGDRYSNDWFHYLGLSFSFITYPVRCPYRENKVAR